jgi:ribulose-phosphate 3-epimerase
LDTPVSLLDPLILNNLDVVLVMAVKAGWGGQEFNSKVIDKIKELDEIRVRDKTPFRICVDGGETESVIDDTHFAGADEVVVGARIFNGNLKENIEKMQTAASTI